MRRIYHLTTPEAWEKAAGKPYRADSLDSEGFIHCSNADQVACAANRFYAVVEKLYVLCLDADRLGTALRDEPASDGEVFPHVYGPIEPDAVVEICPMRRGPDGKWAFGS
jgi:uncharacterized protein (DUF952 family)